MAYAARTRVAVPKTQGEIISLLAKVGAKDHSIGVEQGTAFAAFRFKNLLVKVTVPLPKDNNDQKLRTRWRLLFSILKFRFESIAEGGRVFEMEFLADVVTDAGGATVGQIMLPHLQKANGPLALAEAAPDREVRAAIAAVDAFTKSKTEGP
jgi:hypothetical protein